MKPATPILRNEHYLDVMTGGSASLPSPILREERYLAKLAGMDVSIPSPMTTKEFYYAKICGMDVDVPTYTRNMPRIYAYMAKAAGQTIEDLPTAVTREQRYWFDYVSEQPVTEHEYTGAVPYTFTANGEPLLDWYIKGNTVQSGTPTPDNPIMPQGTGERTGNLSPSLTEWVDGYINSGTGTIHTPTETREKSSDFIRVEPNSVYVFSHENGDFPSGDSGAWRVVGLYDSNKQFINRVGSANPLYLTITTTAETTYIRLSFRTYGGSGNTMLNTGSTALPYEPYGYKLTISSANTTTPIYLGEVETTRKIYKMRLINPLSTTETPNGYRLLFLISSHRATSYQYGGGRCNITKWNGDYNKIGFVAAAQSVFITQNIAEWATLEGATAWLDEHEVYIWYVLENEETGIVNEPLMKIGDYADEVSNAATIPTNNGSTTIDVDTTVKPSEVYIKYKGV